MRFLNLTIRIYNLIQRTTGADKILRFFLREFKNHPFYRCVLDVGSGTGLYRALCPKRCCYIGLDLDWIKLRGFAKKHPYDQAVQGSGMRLPLADASIDLCMMIFVTHHLSTAELEASLKEIARVLKKGGRLFLADAVWNPSNLGGRFLWLLDQGSFKKTASVLRSQIGGAMDIVNHRTFRIIHDYEIFWCRRRS
ncbi:class I SAM-dependent methyltransferase [bacterium]|nr:class I SAM-dependent methyltransferase [bacterium]